MKVIAISLLVLSGILLLSSAVPVDAGNEEANSLVRPQLQATGDKMGLSKRKPPGKVPGPKLTAAKLDLLSLSTITDAVEKKMNRLSNQKKAKEEKSLRESDDNMKMETQERSSLNI